MHIRSYDAARGIRDAADQVQEYGDRAAASPWVERFGSAGIAARGVLYLLVGALAVQMALGSRKSASNEGALRLVAEQPFGQILVGALAVGLAGYALYRLVAGILDPERIGKRGKAIFKRIGDVLTAIVYGGLAVAAFRLVLGERGRHGDPSQALTGRVLSEPFGQIAVGIAGLVVIGVGIGFVVNGVRATFERELAMHTMGPRLRDAIGILGKAGFIARGVVFGIVGTFVVQAAATYNPRRVRGLDGALRELGAQPFGTVLLLTVAVGLAAFGAYSLVAARYHKSCHA